MSSTPNLATPRTGSHLRHLLVLSALAILIVLWTTASAQAAPTWLAPKTLNDTAQPVNVNFASPGVDVAFDPAGNALALWSRYDGATSNPAYRIQAAYRPAGGSWGPAQTVSAAGRDAVIPQVAFDGAGGAVAVWRRYNGSVDIVQVARRGPGPGGQFGMPLDVSLGGASASDPQLAVGTVGAAAGSAIIAWVQGGIVQSRAQEKNGAFSAVQDVQPAGGVDSSSLQLGANANADSALVYVRNSAVEATFRARGGTYATPQAVSNTTAANPSVAVDGGRNVSLIWGFDNGTRRAQSSFKSASSVIFSEGANVPGSTGAQIPRLAVDSDGTAIAVWITDAGGGTFQVQASSRPRNSAYLPPQDVGTPGSQALYPEIAIDAEGRAIAAWKRHDGTCDTFFCILDYFVEATRRPKNGSFGAVESVSSESGGAIGFARPSLGTDQDGNGIAAYERIPPEGGNARAEVAGFDAAGPALTGLLVAGSAIAGDSVGMSVSPLDTWSAVPTVQWNFGDGGTASARSVNHAYGAPGTYTVSVSATDSVGNSRTATRSISIGARPVPPGGGGGAQTLTVLPSTVSSHWKAFRKYTKVDIFAVNDLPAAARVRIQCKTKKKKQQRKGCPYKSRAVTTTFPRSRLPILKPFKKRKMPVGTRITITITAASYIGKQFTFTTRKAKVPKRPRKRCIPPGGKPARCA